VLTAVAGLVAVSIVLLLWLSLRLRRRGTVGKKTGIATRSLLAPLVGLGGWAAGLLVLLTAWPSVSIANQPVSVAFIGTPVAIAVYAAWANRAWSRSIRTGGRCAVTGGALLGAWVGLHAVSGLFSAFTAVLGAVAFANLALVVHDIVRGTRAGSSEDVPHAEILVPEPVGAPAL
jgi:hypothetical protein